MIKIFIDTNIFISAYFFDGTERNIILHQPKTVKYFTSQQVIDEIQSVLRDKFKVDKKDVNRYISKLSSTFFLVNPDFNLNIVVRDEKDTDIIKSALAAKCELLLTGDKDLLTLKQVENTKIINSSQLFKELKMNSL